MKARILFIFAILFYVIDNQSIAQDYQRLILIQPTGKTVNDLPVMSIVHDSTAIARIVDSAYRTTFVGKAVDLYYMAQQYLYNLGEMDSIQPAYLAVTKNQGGFARQGFYLVEKDGSVSDKSAVHYIDLTEGSISAPFERLSSITQLYPHELMHAIYKMLSYEDSAEMVSFNVNMHYFSVITDYNTAFNEGFAEHMENVAVIYEPSNTVRNGKSSSITQMESRLEQRIAGFSRDYQRPFRLDYYRVSMVLWYQQFENYKRNVHAKDDYAAYANDYPWLNSPGDMIKIRNTGIGYDQTRYKNVVQRMASEGFVSTLFTHIAQGEITKIYRPDEFYKQFLADTSMVFNAEQQFSPLQNLFLKYFVVLHRHVNYQQSESAQLIDFIEGYCTEFPDEAHILKRVYSDLAGEEYSPELPPPLWMMARDYDYPVLVMDPFGAITVPIYTFDLNAAEVPDLMTISGINRESAQKVIDFREKIGLFRTFEELKDIGGIDKSTKELLVQSRLDENYFNSLPEKDISMSAIIVTPLLKLARNGLLIFILIGLVIIGLYFKHIDLKHIIFQVVKKLALWILFLVLGLAAIILLDRPVWGMLGFFAAYLLILVIIFRKRRAVLYRNVIISILMAGIVIYSLI